MTSLVNILRTNRLSFGLQECADSLTSTMPFMRPLKINAHVYNSDVCRLYLWCFVYSLIHGTVPAVLKFLSRRHSSKGPFAKYGHMVQKTPCRMTSDAYGVGACKERILAFWIICSLCFSFPSALSVAICFFVACDRILPNAHFSRKWKCKYDSIALLKRKRKT